MGTYAEWVAGQYPQTVQSHCIRRGHIIDGKTVRSTYDAGTYTMGEYDRVVWFTDGTYARWNTGEFVTIEARDISVL